MTWGFQQPLGHTFDGPACFLSSVHTSIVIATPLKDFYHNMSFMPLTKILFCHHFVCSVKAKCLSPAAKLFATLPPFISREVFIFIFIPEDSCAIFITPLTSSHLQCTAHTTAHAPMMHFAHPEFFFLLSFQSSSSTVAEFLLNIASCPRCPYMPCYCCSHTTLLCKYLQAIFIYKFLLNSLLVKIGDSRELPIAFVNAVLAGPVQRVEVSRMNAQHEVGAHYMLFINGKKK